MDPPAYAAYFSLSCFLPVGPSDLVNAQEYVRIVKWSMVSIDRQPSMVRIDDFIHTILLANVFTTSKPGHLFLTSGR